MKSTINSRGELYFRKRRGELLKFIFTFPVFITAVSVLFFIGAKSKSHFYFSIFLSLALALFVIVVIVSIFQKLNRTVNEVTIIENFVEFQTFKIFTFISKKFKIEKSQLKLLPEKFQISKKEIKDGWKIKPINKNYYIYLMKDFFDESILEQLQGL